MFLFNTYNETLVGVKSNEAIQKEKLNKFIRNIESKVVN